MTRGEYGKEYYGNIFDVVQSPLPLSTLSVSLIKSWLLANSFFTKFYMKILVLKINSREIILTFLFNRYETAIIKQSSSFLFSISVCFCKLSLKLAKAISSSSSSCTLDYLKLIAFASFQDMLFVQ